MGKENDWTCLIIAIISVGILTIASENENNKPIDWLELARLRATTGADRNPQPKQHTGNTTIPDSLKHRFPEFNYKRRR